MSSEVKPSQQGKKKQIKIGIKSFYSNTSYSFGNKKVAQVNFVRKCSQKEKPEQERSTHAKRF